MNNDSPSSALQGTRRKTFTLGINPKILVLKKNTVLDLREEKLLELATKTESNQTVIKQIISPAEPILGVIARVNHALIR